MKKFIALLILALWSPVYAGTLWPGVFDSDQSLDTSSNCAESGTICDVRNALELAASDGYLEAPDAEAALVAAEMVAASWGKSNANLPEDLAEWIERQSEEELRALTGIALAAVANVRRAEGSELYALWAEGGASDWLSQLDDLESRLQSDTIGHEP